MITQTNSLLFSCTVEKISPDGSSLFRGVFVTPSSLLVCLLSGGVTQTLSISSVVRLEVSQRGSVDGRPRCMVHLHGGAVSTFSFMSEEDIGRFVDAVSRAAGGVLVVYDGEKKNTGFNVSSFTPKSVQFVDHLTPHGPSQLSTAGAAGHPGSCAVTTPIEPLETVRLTTKVECKAEGGERGEVELSKVQAKEHTSPLRGNVTCPYVLGNPDCPSASAHMEGASPVVIASPPSGLCNSNLQSVEERERQGESDKEPCAQRDNAVDLQERLSSELLSCEQTVSRLTVELDEKNALIEDLKVALSSQENMFQEMLKVTEKMRLMEASKTDLEKRVVFLEAEVRHLEELLNQKSMDHQQELATKLANLHEANKKEVDATHNSFAQYVEQVKAYVGGLLKEKECEARKWGEQERFLKKQIERQRKEISELRKPFELRQCSKSMRNSFLDGNCEVSPLCREAETTMFSLQSPLPAFKTLTSLTDPTLSAEKHAYKRICEKLQRYLDRQT